MGECFCPHGRQYFEQKSHPPTDWAPSVDHYPKLKKDGGKLVLGNVRLAHRLCNRVDYAKNHGIKHAKDRAKAAPRGTRTNPFPTGAPELMEVAESLQEMAEATEGSPSNREREALETNPMIARRLSADRSWFHRPTEPTKELPIASAFLRSAVRGGPEIRSRTDLLDELQQLATHLPDEDLERVLDLARRLSRQ